MEKSKTQLIILVGIAGSGKSTWIKNHLASFSGYTKVVSRDDIRFSIVKENEEYFSHETEVYNKFIEEIKDGLEHCDTTIADATHINEASRTKLLKALGNSLKDVKVIAVVLKPPLQVALAQNAQREGRKLVPRGQVRRMWYQFTKPTLDEGFDEIWTYKNFKYEIEKKEVD